MQRNVRETLIDRTVSVIAAKGLDKTTTKAIVKGTGINEAYIYKYFDSKDALLVTAFDALDEELLSEVMRHLPLMYMYEMDFMMRWRFFFTGMWRFFRRNEERCVAFIRYYYSPYFREYSAEVHQQRYAPFISGVRDAFVPGANVWMLFNHVLTTMLDFAIRVFDGAVPDDEDTEEHVFRLVYYSIVNYFKQTEERQAI